MSKNSPKKKKSTSKYRKFKISPLISVVAIIEVLVLIAITTYAWFVVSQEKNANTGIITVDADSGLDIEFKNVNYNDSINLWDYVPDDFEFTPVTSLDGRNVFIPTSGTFGNTATNNIVYRDATINDINTKYINVDFMLTNTTNQDVNVYLNDNSSFNVYSGGSLSNNSRALRLAFYTNDAKHGKVNSSILSNTNQENAALDKMDNTVTVYFNKPTTNKWTNSDAYAYIWKTSGGTNYEVVSWPGSKMTHVAGSVYSYTFSNTNGYTGIIFNNGDANGVAYNGSNATTYTQTRNLSLLSGTGSNSRIFEATAAANNTGTAYTTKTVYFRKPSDWSGVRAHAFKASGDPTSFTGWPGDVCKDCGADIYSYTFPATYNGNAMGGIVFNNLGNDSQKTADLLATDGSLYYFTSGGSDGACSSTTYSETKIYFNNYLGWGAPYAILTSTSGHVTRVAMTNLSAGIFYATVPSVYTQIAFEDRSGLNEGATQTDTNKYTRSAAVTKGYIYRPETKTSTGYTLQSFSYINYVGDEDDPNDESYAVISPGVSANFQRSYTPVVGIASSTGAPTQLVPAFASSIDNYFKGSQNPMFSIPQNGMLDLSMIIWLEGTDDDCTNSNYASTATTLKDIFLKLEFSTNIAGQERAVDSITNYTYRFYDSTREVWTSDRLTNAAGVSVAPVMQLYDNTVKRGYLMHAGSTTYINGKRKIDMWECSAPATLYQDGHDLYFRRVDPYNEDEIWNYWHPVAPDQCNGAAFQTIDGVGYVNFTAFADGAPASTAESGIAGNTTVLTAANSSNGNTPARSCGGLWGKYSTQLLTVIDGTDQNYIKNDKGVMTLNYTYSYGNSKTQTIEYKASGAFYNQVYYFVVPTVLKDSTSKASGFTFKRYYNFANEYAMNIYNRNSTMNYDSGAKFIINSALTGYYAEVSKTPSGTKQSWFGKDLLYCNISYSGNDGNSNLFNGNTIQFKMLYKTNSANISLHDSSASSSTGVTEYNFLYTNNGSFSHNGFNGYLTVVPVNATKLTVARCLNTSNNWTTTYNWLNADCTYNSANHNLVLTKWDGNEPNNIGYSYNNNDLGGFPAIPSVE